MNPRTLAAPAVLLFVALALGVTFERLFYAQWIGVNVPIFVALLLGTALYLSRRENVPVQKRNLLLLAPTALFFAGMSAVRANQTLSAINLIYTAMLLILCAYFWTAGNIADVPVKRFLIAPFFVLGNLIFRAGEPLFSALSKSAKRHEELPATRFLPVLRGLLIALPILLVFGALLSSADAVFGKYTGAFFQNLARFDIYFPRLIVIGFIFWIVAGALTFALTRYENVPETSVALAHRPFGLTESLTVLASVNLLFMSFLALQFSYLFGGAQRALAISGMNYAAYARRGFWELVCVALLTGGLIILLREVTRRLDDRSARIFSGLSTSLIACTLCLLISAAQRMMAYEQAWGATQLRLIVDVFLVWLALALVWMGITLWRWQDKLVVGVLVCAIGYAATLNFVDIDNHVVTRNVQIFRETGRLDTEHLRYLSEDAVPAMRDAFEKLDGKQKAALRQMLQDRISYRSRESMMSPGFNLSRFRATVLLDNLVKTNKEFHDGTPAYTAPADPF